MGEDKSAEEERYMVKGEDGQAREGNLCSSDLYGLQCGETKAEKILHPSLFPERELSSATCMRAGFHVLYGLQWVRILLVEGTSTLAGLNTVIHSANKH